MGWMVFFLGMLAGVLAGVTLMCLLFIAKEVERDPWGASSQIIMTDVKQTDSK